MSRPNGTAEFKRQWICCFTRLCGHAVAYFNTERNYSIHVRCPHAWHGPVCRHTVSQNASWLCVGADARTPFAQDHPSLSAQDVTKHILKQITTHPDQQLQEVLWKDVIYSPLITYCRCFRKEALLHGRWWGLKRIVADTGWQFMDTHMLRSCGVRKVFFVHIFRQYNYAILCWMCMYTYANIVLNILLVHATWHVSSVFVHPSFGILLYMCTMKKYRWVFYMSPRVCYASVTTRKRASFLFLDEATSALDNASEWLGEVICRSQ